MSKYTPLWQHIAACGQPTLTLTFDEISRILGFPIDHAFLSYKKELTGYGYAVSKISMKQQRLTVTQTAPQDALVLYIHGQGGSANEAEHYKPLFPGCTVMGLDYGATTPWEAAKEFPAALQRLSAPSQPIILIANSIGAYFALCAMPQSQLRHAFLISPVVDMERLILGMLSRSGLTEELLREKGTIETAWGETLSWDYLCYVRTHSLRWSISTDILYGAQDTLTSRDTVSAFAATHHARLTIMENGEHWFHTPEQMAFLDHWITEGLVHR